MVRVVSCHHFLSQDVFLSQNEPVAFCCAQGKLLVATTQHAVNVHDLESRGNVLHSFPTVDLVKQIIYCESGNYVATVESKASWHRSLVTYVRIYFKWWIDVNGQPLKVRVAGSDAPNANPQSWNKIFEMVELPLDKTAICISCCSKTSSLAVSLGNTISVFCYCIKVDSTSKQTFHDFDHFVDINVPIVVHDLKVCENYYACMSDIAIHVFKIIGEKNEDKQMAESIPLLEDDLPDSELYDENFIEWRFESCTGKGNNDKKWEEHLKSKLHPKSFPINIHLPAIDKENEQFSCKEECEICGPVLTVRGCTVDVRLDSKVFEIFPMVTSNVNAVTLLFRQFITKENSITLTGLQLVPLYITEDIHTDYSDPLNAAASALEKCSFSLPWPNLSSPVTSLKAVGCFFSTPQEGYLYDVTYKTRLISCYTYTATLKGVAVETSLLHALTETGLETYTVHLPISALHYIENFDGIKNILPNFDDAVCLLGLRPFLGVDHLIMSENHVILASSVEDSVANNETDNGNRSTLYSLKKATPVQVFMDLLEAGETHKSTSSTTYYNLLSAAHMILRTQLLCNQMKDPETESLYQKSCLLLADYFVLSDSTEQLNAIPYYYLSHLSSENVIQRMVDLSQQNKHINVLKPLVHYLNSLLLEDDSLINFTPSQAITEVVLSAYTEDSPELLWRVVLCSDLSGYKIDKIILILKRRLTSKRHPLSPISNAADTTALVYLLLQKGSIEAAQNMILSLCKGDLVTILNNVHSKLFTRKKLSMLGKFIKEARPDAFIELLLCDIENKKSNVNEVIQLLQNEAPNFDFHCVPLLKEFLEALLSDKKILSQVDSTTLILLVKIYLKRLLEPPDKGPQSSNSFSGNMGSLTALYGSRSSWLNEMPPFNGKGIARSCILPSLNEDKSDSSVCCCWTCNEDLLRLQSLLSHLGPSEEVKGLVLDFLCSAKGNKTNWLSLEVMCSNEAQAIKILIGVSPKALLPYAKDTIKADERKWCMLFKLLYEHMIGLPEDHPQLEVYSQTFQGVLAHLAETLKPVEFLGLLPLEENPVFVPHLKRCVEKHQADLLKNKIISLGQEIKSMMLY